MIDFNKKMYAKDRLELVEVLKDLQATTDFRVSARGWCYLMEQKGYVTKSQFNKVEEAINTCRKEGTLPVDFVAEEDARAFTGVETPSGETIKELLSRMLYDVLHGYNHFAPDWWEGEDYYIQVLVEKVDLKTLFAPVCKDYRIPIANAKGWSSVLQRAEYARRFQEAETQGLKCVLLYCGDLDPDGLRISDAIRKNIQQISDVKWSDSVRGYDPKDLIIERVGLNYDFVIQNNYSWIDNLITGAGKNLASKKHPNFKYPYIQNYLSTIGERKCESNVMITTPDIARQLLRTAIEKYLGVDAVTRFQEKRQVIQDLYQSELEQLGIVEIDDLEMAIRHLDKDIAE
jgi:phosphoribosylformylglycinamidine (FGAM) synthase PurS component